MPITLREDDRLYFLHIRKTAGSTLNVVLENHFRAFEICPAYHWHGLLQIEPNQLARYRLFRGHFNYSLQQLLKRAPITITFLRDPVDRVLSRFEFARREPLDYLHDDIVSTEMSLECFIEDPVMSATVSNHQVRSMVLDVDVFALAGQM